MSTYNFKTTSTKSRALSNNGVWSGNSFSKVVGYESSRWRIQTYELTIPESCLNSDTNETEPISQIDKLFVEFGLGYNSKSNSIQNSDIYAYILPYGDDGTEPSFTLETMYNSTKYQVTNAVGSRVYPEVTFLKDSNNDAFKNKQYRIYVVGKPLSGENASFPSVGYIYWDSAQANSVDRQADLTLDYTSTTKCIAPTNLGLTRNDNDLSGIVSFQETLKVTWDDPGQGGVNNDLTGYVIYWRVGSSPTKSIQDGYFVLEGDQSFDFVASKESYRGSRIYFSIEARGTAGPAYYSDLADLGNYILNTIPSVPTYTLPNGNICPSTEGSIPFEIQPGSDTTVVGSLQVWYRTGNNEEKTKWDFNNVKSITPKTYHFSTWDGLEWSEEITIVITQNSKPVIESFIVKQNESDPYSYTLSFKGDKEDVDLLWEITIGNTPMKLTGSEGNITISDIRYYVAPEVAAGTFTFKATCNDGIEDSDKKESGSYNKPQFPSITGVKNNKNDGPIEGTLYYYGGLVFLTDGEYYEKYQLGIKIGEKDIGTVNGNANQYVFNNIQNPNGVVRLYWKYLNITKDFEYNDCTFAVAAIGNFSDLLFAGGDSTPLKPYTAIFNEGASYFLFNLPGYTDPSERNGLELIQVSPNDYLELKIGIGNNLQPFTIAGISNNGDTVRIDLGDLENLLELSEDKNKSYEGIAYLTITSDYEQVEQISQKLTIDFRETPVLPDKINFTANEVSFLKEGIALNLNFNFTSYNSSPAISLYINRDYEGENNWVPYGDLTIDKSDNEHEYTANLSKLIGKITRKEYKANFKLVATNSGGLPPTEFNLTKTPVQVYGHYEGQMQLTSVTYDGTNLNVGYNVTDLGLVKVKNVENCSIESKITKISIDNKESSVQIADTSSFSHSYTFPDDAEFVNFNFTITTTFEYLGAKSTYSFTSNTLAVYNILPTISYRKNVVGVNISNPEGNENAVFVVGAYNERKLVCFAGTNHAAQINLETGELTGFVIDGGSWD